MNRYVIPKKGGNCTSHKDFKYNCPYGTTKIFKVLYVDPKGYENRQNKYESVVICEGGFVFYEEYTIESTEEAYEKQEGIFKKPDEDLTYLIPLLKTLE